VNKYTAIGLLAAAAEGKRIIVLSPHHRAVQDAVHEVHEVFPDLQWRRTNGDARVTVPSGGTIDFLTRRQLRGRTADVLLIEDDRDLDVDFIGEMRAVVGRAPDGVVVRY
jgi:hypothetical protein